MPTRRRLLAALGTATAGAFAGCNGGSGTDDQPAPADLRVTSEAFADGASIPQQYTAQGENVSPPLSFEGVPDEAETLALIADDPDAAGGAFTHWLLWNLPADRRSLSAGVPKQAELNSGARQGANSTGIIGYSGPAPPTDADPHTYRFTVYAVDTTLDLAAGSLRAPLEDALDGSTLRSARLTGTYGR